MKSLRKLIAACVVAITAALPAFTPADAVTSKQLELLLQRHHAVTPQTQFILGLNFSGMEDLYPQPTTLAEFTYYANRNFTKARLPITWGGNNPTYGKIGIQPIPNGPLDTVTTSPFAGGYAAELDAVLANMASVGMSTLLDIHTFGVLSSNDFWVN
jgi:hypothetical protein